MTKDKEGCYIMIKVSVHQEHMAVLHMNATNKSFKAHETETDRTKRKNKFTITVEDFNTPSQQLIELLDKNITKDTDLNTINQQDLNL